MSQTTASLNTITHTTTCSVCGRTRNDCRHVEQATFHCPDCGGENLVDAADALSVRCHHCNAPLPAAEDSYICAACLQSA